MQTQICKTIYTIFPVFKYLVSYNIPINFKQETKLFSCVDVNIKA